MASRPHAAGQVEAMAIVAVVVSMAPTANNIVVMAELWGGAPTKVALSVTQRTTLAEVGGSTGYGPAEIDTREVRQPRV